MGHEQHNDKPNMLLMAVLAGVCAVWGPFATAQEAGNELRAGVCAAFGHPERETRLEFRARGRTD